MSNYRERLERIRAESKEVGEKAVFFGSAFAGGALVGFANAKEGGSASAPYQVAGKVPLDTGIALAGLAAGFFMRKHPHIRPALFGAAAGAIGVVGARYGAVWEGQNPLAGLLSSSSSSSSSGGSSTPSGASSSSSTASTGYGGTMAPRLASHGSYGSRNNPYARNFATAGR